MCRGNREEASVFNSRLTGYLFPISEKKLKILLVIPVFFYKFARNKSKNHLPQ